jgi:hypothetical protein
MKKTFYFGFDDLDSIKECMDELESKYVRDSKEWCGGGNDDFDESKFDFSWYVGYGDDVMNGLVVGDKILNDEEMLDLIDGCGGSDEVYEDEMDCSESESGGCRGCRGCDEDDEDDEDEVKVIKINRI